MLHKLARKTRHKRENSKLFWQEIFTLDLAAKTENTLSRPGGCIKVGLSQKVLNREKGLLEKH